MYAHFESCSEKGARSLHMAFEVISAYLKSHPNTNHQLLQRAFFDCAVIFCWPLICAAPTTVVAVTTAAATVATNAVAIAIAIATIHSDPFHI